MERTVIAAVSPSRVVQARLVMSRMTAGSGPAE
jgi:hypothetical protein